MTKKKSILSLILAVFLIIPAMFMFTACGNKPISEKGKTYSVQNKQKDVTIKWGDDKDELIEAEGSEENLINGLATFSIIFSEDGKVSISFGGGKDEGKYYAIDEDNYLEFYESAENAENRSERLTGDYFSAKYKFSKDKKTITITTQVGKSEVTIKLSSSK